MKKVHRRVLSVFLSALLLSGSICTASSPVLASELPALEAKNTLDAVSEKEHTANSTYALVAPAAEDVINLFSDTHPALDLSAPFGSSVVAAEQGVVVKIQMTNAPITERSAAYGNMVLLEHPDGNQTLYAHLDEISVSVGETVSRGQHLGSIGTTGDAKEPMLHFEVVTPLANVDPLPYITTTSLYSQASTSSIKADLEGGTNYISDFGRITRASLIAELQSHEHDNYYLNTPYYGGDHQSPNGDRSYNGYKGMNCAGFIGYVLRKSGLNASAAIKSMHQVPGECFEWNSGLPYDELAGASNYYLWARNANLKCHVYDSINQLLSSGQADKGDLILYYVNQPWLLAGGEDNHLTIYWGDTPFEGLVWHQTGFNDGDVNGNLYNQIVPMSYYISYAKFILIKMDDTNYNNTVVRSVGHVKENVRAELLKGPGSRFSTITTLPANAAVTVLDKSNPVWYKVQYGKKIGYVASKYLSFKFSDSFSPEKIEDTEDTPSATPAPSFKPDPVKKEDPASESLPVAWISCDGSTSLRYGPGYNYYTMVEIPDGKSVKVLDRSDPNWYKVQYRSYTGYIHSRYIRFKFSDFSTSDPITPETTFPVPTPKPEMTIQDWHKTLVNPWNKLPENYHIPLKIIPGDTLQIDARCCDYLVAMMRDCEAAGYNPYICSAYRTNGTQTYLYERQVQFLIDYYGMSRETAEIEAAKSVAVPGTSEHQLGLAVDILDLYNPTMTDAQENTPTQKWLLKNCWKYGFILRFPKGKSDITGVIYEPWHYRYVGYKLAKTLHDCDLTLEEYVAAVKASPLRPNPVCAEGLALLSIPDSNATLSMDTNLIEAPNAAPTLPRMPFPSIQAYHDLCTNDERQRNIHSLNP